MRRLKINNAPCQKTLRSAEDADSHLDGPRLVETARSRVRHDGGAGHLPARREQVRTGVGGKRRAKRGAPVFSRTRGSPSEKALPLGSLRTSLLSRDTEAEGVRFAGRPTRRGLSPRDSARQLRPPAPPAPRAAVPAPTPGPTAFISNSHPLCFVIISRKRFK